MKFAYAFQSTIANRQSPIITTGANEVTSEINNQQSKINNPKPPRLLVVDDDEQIRRMLGRILAREGYTFTPAADGVEARKCLQNQDFDLALCDVNMPGESGIELAGYIASRCRDTAVVMITGIDDRNVAEQAVEAGIYGYMIKPFNPNEVIINIRNALRRRDLEIANRDYRENLELMVEERTKQLRKAMEGIIRAMALTVESRDPYTSGHQQRVAQLARAMAKEMGLSKDQVQGVYLAGLIHDLGKISIPAEILSKPTKLTDIEFSLIKTHPQVGYEILKGISFPWPIAKVMFQHHERINGKGYPLGISGDDIVIEAKIIGVADVVEAMASHRPYRPALGIDKALEEISNNKGILYDSEVVDACTKLFCQQDFKF